MDNFTIQFEQIIDGGIAQLSNIKPSDWTEENVVMGQPFPGKYRYSRTPYCREIIDRLSSEDPARWIAVMKGLQIGVSSGVIIPGLLWTIKEAPCNTYFTVGAPDLVDKATEKLDIGIQSAGIKDYIRPQVQRKRAQKTGDTNDKKDFSGGYIVIASANNHKNWRDVSLKHGFFDDFEAVKSKSKESGDTRKLIEGRFAAYANTHKIFYISTPEVKSTSNIEPAYLLGDQRKYLTPCPHCGVLIEWVWSVKNGGINGGITWELDDNGKVISSKVGYTCQECGGFYTDKNKHELLNAGRWQPTALPSKPGYFSYHISSLYAPIGMYNWEHYVNDYLEANPPGQPRNESLHQTFVNTCLGLTYEPSAQSPKATSIQKNIRPYKVGCVPEKLSLSDGNGRIILLTCAADMNGKPDDARLDYEIVAWSEAGASYSIKHGSIGTFIPRENTRREIADREKWTYETGKHQNVWEEFVKIIKADYFTDTNRKMCIMQTGLDCGFFSANHAYPFIDRVNPIPTIYVVGLKGRGQDEYIRFNKDLKYFTPAKERPNLFTLTVGKIKDDLAEYMQLTWNENDPSQQFGFMNFPTPEGGMYTFTNYFEHFESEHCVMVANKDGSGVSSRWEKKNSAVMNHMFDCRVYNMAMREIIIDNIRRELKAPKLTWKEFCAVITGGR